MSTVSELRKLLAEEYGLTSDIELNRALSTVNCIDIGVFTAPINDKASMETK